MKLKDACSLEEKQNLYSIFREGNGTPLQYSCLENPMDLPEEPGRLQIPVFLPGESQNLVGCCLWDGTESDTTQAT